MIHCITIHCITDTMSFHGKRELTNNAKLITWHFRRKKVILRFFSIPSLAHGRPRRGNPENIKLSNQIHLILYMSQYFLRVGWTFFQIDLLWVGRVVDHLELPLLVVETIPKEKYQYLNDFMLYFQKKPYLRRKFNYLNDFHLVHDTKRKPYLIKSFCSFYR